MIIEVVFTHVCKSCGKSNQIKFKKGAVRIWVKHGFKMSNGVQGVKEDCVNCGQLNPVQSS
jgi:hypothetical protein